MHTDDDGRAAQILGSETFTAEVVEDAGGLLCRVAASDVPRVAEVLLDAGLALHQLTPRRASLEDVYIRHYGRDPGQCLS